MVACLLGMVALAIATPADALPARERSPSSAPPESTLSEPDRAVLYTIGPGPSLFERWGHTLLCFQPGSSFLTSGALVGRETPDTEVLIDTSCFDFGIFPRSSISDIVTGSLRGKPLFIPRELPYQNAVGRYWWLDRTIQRQVLPFSSEQVFDLRDRLNEVVLRGEGYAYHPFYNNCSTQVRDVLDEFSGGRLRGEGSAPTGSSLRAIAEQGFSGQVLLLSGMELLVGSSADKATSEWQRGAFPEGLSALVDRRLGVKEHLVYKQTWLPLPTSIHAGRVLLFAVCAFVCGALLWARRQGGVTSTAWRRAVCAFGVLVAGIGLLSLLLRFYSVYPEFASSWTALIFFPLDAALPWMGARARKRYIMGRLVLLVFLGSLSLLHFLVQPVVIVALFVGLPLGLIFLFEFGRNPTRPPSPSRWSTASGVLTETS